MLLNRQRVGSGILGLSAMPGLSGRSDGDDHDYAATVAINRAPMADVQPGHPLRLRELVRMATLAPNSHNTQPWQFAIGPDGITITPDPARRCPVADPDDHHLFVSLGCAAENLSIAATGYGLKAKPGFKPDGGGRIEVALWADEALPPSDLLPAIPERQSTRSDYLGLGLSDAERGALVAPADSAGIRLIEDLAQKARIRDLVIAGNSAQMADDAFVHELRDWIRFNADAAVRKGDGLFTGASGNPELPGWLGRMAFPLLFREQSEAAKYRRQIDSSAALAVFVDAKDDPAEWVETGRRFQRFGLLATRLGLAHAHVNQAVEVPDMRAALERELGIDRGRASLVVRVGRAAPLPYSLRRPVADVIV